MLKKLTGVSYKSKYDDFYICFANHSKVSRALDDFQQGAISKSKCIDMLIKYMREDYQLKQSTINELAML